MPGGGEDDESGWLALDMSDDEDVGHRNVYAPCLYRWRHTIKTQQLEELTRRRDRLEKQLEDHTEAAVRLTEAMRRSSLRGRNASFQPFVTAVDVLRRKTQIDERKLAKTQKAIEGLPLTLDDLVDDYDSRTCSRRLFRAATAKKTTDGRGNKKTAGHRREDDVRTLCWLQKVGDNVTFLEANPHLLGDQAIDELSRICIGLAVQEKFEALKHAASQYIFLWQVRRLVRTSGCDPVHCLRVVANRYRLAEAICVSGPVGNPFSEDLFHAPITKAAAEEYSTNSNHNVQQFVWYVREQASKHMRKSYFCRHSNLMNAAAKGTQLDPITVLESLPVDLQKGFENQNVLDVNRALQNMDESEARYHMRRCVLSNLWRPCAQDQRIDRKTGLMDATALVPALSARGKHLGATIEGSSGKDSLQKTYQSRRKGNAGCVKSKDGMDGSSKKKSSKEASKRQKERSKAASRSPSPISATSS